MEPLKHHKNPNGTTNMVAIIAIHSGGAAVRTEWGPTEISFAEAAWAEMVADPSALIVTMLRQAPHNSWDAAKTFVRS